MAALRDAAEGRERHGEEAKSVEGPPPALVPYVGSAALKTLLTMHDLKSQNEDDANFALLTPEQLRPYFTLARTVLVEAPVKEEPLIIPDLVRVPAGEFLMGTSDQEIDWLVKNTDWAKERKDKGYFEDEKSRHSIDLNYDYQIGKYPVMNVDYQRFVIGSGYRAPPGWEGQNYPEGRGDHPVVNVSWENAMAYCQWLTEILRKEGKLPKDQGVRLPTEAEWEKAASWDAGKKAKRIYPWGDEFDSMKCNTDEGGKESTTPVGQYPAGDSYFGIGDMAGNVWEWCHSLYKPYPYNVDDGREDGASLEVRVRRGGSWRYYQWFARCASRTRVVPDYFSGYVGFRVVVAARLLK